MRVCEHEWRERDGRVGDVFEARIGRKKSGRGEYGTGTVASRNYR